MAQFLVLVAPSANRVYADAAPALVAAEARVLTAALIGPGAQTACTRIAGVDYVQVRVPDEAGGDGIRLLSNLSATHALFQQEGDLLRPVPLQRRDRYPSDLVTIPKYRGKTNEQWTRLMLGVTAAATARPRRWLDDGLVVLDPMCGRGTTLNLALLCGYDATGVDLDAKDYEAYTAFLKTWLRQHRLKHTATESALRVDGRARGRRFEVQTAPTKEQFKAGDLQRVTYLRTDTADLDGLLRSASVDVVVADTPYGVQHGSHGDRLSRRPLDLLDQALPGWLRVLRTGGAVGLSYNRHVAPPAELLALLERHGLEPVTGPGYADLRHRVDASIDRDLMVARKAGAVRPAQA